MLTALLFLFVLVFLALGIYLIKRPNTYTRAEILKWGIRTQGVIIDLEIFGFDLFHRFPRVRFTTRSGQQLTLTSSDKVHLSEFKKEQIVEVSYMLAAPEHFAIISGLDVLFKSETQEPSTYRLAKGQERRHSTSRRPKRRGR